VHDAEIAKLAQSCSGLPLAIELVAGQVATFGPETVLLSLQHNTLILDQLDRALDASWKLLTRAEQNALAALQVFGGSFNLSWAEALAGNALQRIDTLVASSFLALAPENESAVSCFFMPDAIRSFVRRRCSGMINRMARRHASYFALTEHSTPDARHELFAAWSWAIQHDAHVAAQLALRLESSLLAHGPPEQHRTVFEQSLRALNPSTSSVVYLDLLLGLGRNLSHRGLHGRAVVCYREALSRATAIRDTTRIAWSAALLCFSLRPLGRIEESRTMGSFALEQQKWIGATARPLAMARIALACTEIVSGHQDKALEHLRHVTALHSTAEGLRIAAIARANMALLYAACADFVRAKELLDGAYSDFESIADHFHVARLSVYRVSLFLDTFEAHDAYERLAHAHALTEAQDDRDGAFEAKLGMSLCARRMGNTRKATLHREECELSYCSADTTVLMPSAQGLYTLVLEEPTDSQSIALGRDGRTLHLGARTVSLARRGPLRRVLLALVERRLHSLPPRALSVRELVEVGWPGERMRDESGNARVYMVIRRLRALGLKLETLETGYVIPLHIAVTWTHAESPLALAPAAKSSES
jgi:tetratricopeptide (TPR) repeat protein